MKCTVGEEEGLPAKYAKGREIEEWAPANNANSANGSKFIGALLAGRILLLFAAFRIFRGPKKITAWCFATAAR